jgi:hypothetical protein
LVHDRANLVHCSVDAAEGHHFDSSDGSKEAKVIEVLDHGRHASGVDETSFVAPLCLPVDSELVGLCSLGVSTGL